MSVRPLTEDELEKLANNMKYHKGTRNQNQWAKNRFQDWVAKRKESVPEDVIPPTIDDVPAEQLSSVLVKFATEITDVQGLSYNSKTFITLLHALSRVCVDIHGPAGDFFDEKDARFRFLNKVLAGKIRELRDSEKKVERGETRVKPDIITDEVEAKLWDKSFDLEDARGLLRALIYVLCKTLMFRGTFQLGDISLADIKMTQYDDESMLYTYTERSRSDEHRLRKQIGEGNVIQHLSSISDKKDLHHVLTEYLRHCPQDVLEATDANPVKLLRHPTQRITKMQLASRTTWYATRPVGRNYFRVLFHESFRLAGIQETLLQRTVSLLRASTFAKLRARGEFSVAEIKTRAGNVSDYTLKRIDKTINHAVSDEHSEQGDLLKRLSTAIRGNTSPPSSSSPSKRSRQSSLDISSVSPNLTPDLPPCDSTPVLPPIEPSPPLLQDSALLLPDPSLFSPTDPTLPPLVCALPTPQVKRMRVCRCDSVETSEMSTQTDPVLVLPLSEEGELVKPELVTQECVKIEQREYGS